MTLSVANWNWYITTAHSSEAWPSPPRAPATPGSAEKQRRKQESGVSETQRLKATHQPLNMKANRTLDCLFEEYIVTKDMVELC
jgi:hypothetical protein